MTTTTFFTRVLAAIFIALWGKPLWDPFTQGFMNVAMLCTSLSKLRTFSNFDTFDFFFTVVIMDNFIFIYVESQDLRGKVGKGGVAGGTRLLGTDRSVFTIQPGRFIND